MCHMEIYLQNSIICGIESQLLYNTGCSHRKQQDNHLDEEVTRPVILRNHRTSYRATAVGHVMPTPLSLSLCWASGPTDGPSLVLASLALAPWASWLGCYNHSRFMDRTQFQESLRIPPTGRFQCSKKKTVYALNSHVSNTSYLALFQKVNINYP